MIFFLPTPGLSGSGTMGNSQPYRCEAPQEKRSLVYTKKTVPKLMMVADVNNNVCITEEQSQP